MTHHDEEFVMVTLVLIANVMVLIAVIILAVWS